MIKIWYWIWGSIKSKLPAILCTKDFNSPIDDILLESTIGDVDLDSPITLEFNYNERDVCW